MRGLLRVEHVMGTTVTLDVRDSDVHGRRLTLAVDRAVEVLHEADRMFSTYRPDSVVSEVRRGLLKVSSGPPELHDVVARCAAATLLSDGWFDPSAMAGGFDPTGLVKGWAAQRALLAMADLGVRHASVNAGGDVAVLGSPTSSPTDGWRVGVTDPFYPARVLAVVSSRDAGVATSGGYERGSLAVDPRRGGVVRRLASATVVSADLGVADALSTAAAAHGVDALAWLTAAPGAEALLVSLDGRVLTTPGWQGTPPGWQGTIVSGPVPGGEEAA